jgi:large subunit ribosomal protein L6
MSRIGKQPVKIPAGVKVEINQQQVKLTGPVGSLVFSAHSAIKVVFDNTAAEIKVSRSSDDRYCRALHGTTRALIANMVHGVTKGYQKDMAIYGTGYTVKVQGTELVLQVGFAAPANLSIPKGVTIDIKAPNARGNDVPAQFSIRGPDKGAVGQFAADVRNVRPPEPYRGKGVRYANEVIKRKVGKAFASGAA